MSQSSPRPRRRPAALRSPSGDVPRQARAIGRLAGGAAGRVTGTVVAATTAAQDVVGGAAKALATPTGLLGAAVEAAWLTTHLALYPWGLVGRHGRDSQL